MKSIIGMHVLMPASLAIEMGVPIYGIVALSNTATDKEGRSVPAPGQGILTTAKEASTKNPLIFSLEYRKRQMRLLRKKIASWVEQEYNHLKVCFLALFLFVFLNSYKQSNRLCIRRKSS